MSGMHPGRDWKCDRNGGMGGRYLERKPWLCPHCDVLQVLAGHICDTCHRRICCGCFDHESGCCISSSGALTSVNSLKRPAESCAMAIGLRMHMKLAKKYVRGV